MIKALKKLLVIQEKEFFDEYGGAGVRRRLNPYNPLTYVLMLVVLVIGVLMYGFVGIKKEMDWDDFMCKWS